MASVNTAGPLQTANGFRETSFWNDTFDHFEEDGDGSVGGGDGYLDVADGGDDADDENALSMEAAMMLQ